MQRFKSRNLQFRELIADKLSRQHFMKLLGIELTVVEEGYMEAEAPLRQELQQQDGKVHGGVTATMADIATGFAAFSLVEPHKRVVTADLKVSYLAPGRGDRIRAKGWVVKPGKRLFFCEGEIWVDGAEGSVLIAKTNALMAAFVPSEPES